MLEITGLDESELIFCSLKKRKDKTRKRNVGCVTDTTVTTGKQKL